MNSVFCVRKIWQRERSVGKKLYVGEGMGMGMGGETVAFFVDVCEKKKKKGPDGRVGNMLALVSDPNPTPTKKNPPRVGCFCRHTRRKNIPRRKKKIKNQKNHKGLIKSLLSALMVNKKSISSSYVDSPPLPIPPHPFSFPPPPSPPGGRENSTCDFFSRLRAFS